MTADFTGHWHGYEWEGVSSAYYKEAQRRPGLHPADLQTQTFLASALPPMMTGHWLLRPRAAHPDRTWASPQLAVEWLEGRYKARPPYTRPDGARAYVSLAERLAYAVDVIPRGVDVTWCYWTSPAAGMLVSASVVACPSRHHPTIPCPLPPATGRQEPARTDHGRRPHVPV